MKEQTIKVISDGKVLIPKKSVIKAGDFWVLLMPVLKKIKVNKKEFRQVTTPRPGIFNLVGSVPAQININNDNIHKLRKFVGFSRGQRVANILQDQ